MSELLAAEPDMVLGLVAALNDRNEARRWTMEHELLAEIVEMLSVVRNEALAIAGVKHFDLPPRVHIPRPGQEAEDEVPVVSPAEFAQMTAAA